MTEQELAQQREYRTVSYLVSTLANMCAGSPNQIIDLLTGYLWDEEEAGSIKIANMTGKARRRRTLNNTATLPCVALSAVLGDAL